MLDDGEVERRVRLLRPMERPAIAARRARRRRIGRRPTATPSPRAWKAELADVPGIHRQRSAHRHRPAAADLEAAARRCMPRLSAPDRCRRTHHRPAGLARLGGAGGRQPMRRRSRRPTPGPPCSTAAPSSQLAGRAAASPRQGDGRVPRRARRLHRRHGRPAEGDGPHLGDHRLEAAPVRADRRERARRFSAALMERHPLVRIADRAAA